MSQSSLPFLLYSAMRLTLLCTLVRWVGKAVKKSVYPRLPNAKCIRLFAREMHIRRMQEQDQDDDEDEDEGVGTMVRENKSTHSFHT